MSAPADRATQARRLRAAGYAHVAGWVPLEYAAQVEATAAQHRAAVEKLAASARPRGRPRKPAAADQ